MIIKNSDLSNESILNVLIEQDINASSAFRLMSYKRIIINCR
jgi:hypothetical protein